MQIKKIIVGLVVTALFCFLCSCHDHRPDASSTGKAIFSTESNGYTITAYCTDSVFKKVVDSDTVCYKQVKLTFRSLQRQSEYLLSIKHSDSLHGFVGDQGLQIDTFFNGRFCFKIIEISNAAISYNIEFNKQSDGGVAINKLSFKTNNAGVNLYCIDTINKLLDFTNQNAVLGKYTCYQTQYDIVPLGYEGSDKFYLVCNISDSLTSTATIVDENDENKKWIIIFPGKIDKLGSVPIAGVGFTDASSKAESFISFSYDGVILFLTMSNNDNTVTNNKIALNVGDTLALNNYLIRANKSLQLKKTK